MSEALVEFTKEQLLGFRESFEGKATMFIADHRNRRISKLMKAPRTVKFFGFTWNIPGVDRDEAERLYNGSENDLLCLGAVVGGINHMREILLTADKAPPGTKFLVPAPAARWFLQ